MRSIISLRCVLSVSLIFLFFSFVSAQEPDVRIIKQDIDIGKAMNNDLDNVLVYFLDLDSNFVNMQNNSFFSLRPGQRKRIGVVFDNQSSQYLPFSTQIVSANQQNDGTFLCSNNLQESQSDRHILYAGQNDSGVLSGKSQKMYVLDLEVPLSLTGVTAFCIVYSLLNSSDLTVGMFQIEYRRAHVIKIDIIGDAYNFGWFDDIKYYYQDNNRAILVVAFIVLSISLAYTLWPVFKDNKKITKK